MKAGDICLEFKLAKDRKKQIGILADENMTSPEEIVLILYEHGEIQKWPEKYMLTNVLDSLEEQISSAEKKLHELNMRYKSIADLLKGENKLGAEK